MEVNSQQNTPLANENYSFTNQNFDTIRDLVNKRTGISLSDHKRDLVYGRLTKRLRALGLCSFDQYCDLLINNANDEMEHFTNAITTNLTSFFRENHHFEFLSKKFLPELIEQNQLNGLRIWSAGCSTGEEPYSLAITLRESIPNIDRYDIRILATDLDTNVVTQAASGIYTEKRVEDLPKDRIRRWFKKGKNAQSGHVKVREELQNMITFRKLNLMENWPMQRRFDLIFCRNVVIYFDKSTQRVLFNRFAEQLHDHGHLIIGHSENLHNITDRFSLIGKTVYKRTL